jgi:predicted PhzF superfamily epimerase YddE/YHI9
VPVFVIDAFTDKPFRGNPAGVVLLDAPAEPIWMQQVAAELRHSETAFVYGTDAGRYHLRWFTPTVEVDLCGHATLAATHALTTLGHGDAFEFSSRSGPLFASVARDGAITLDFPARLSDPYPTDPRLPAALGTPVLGCYGDDDRVIVEVASPAEVIELVPDISALTVLPQSRVIVTAAGGNGVDFVSRMFAPQIGIDEDPVTGGAHCVLTPFWASRLGRNSMRARQVSARGGDLVVELRGNRVYLTGQAVIVLTGELT